MPVPLSRGYRNRSARPSGSRLPVAAVLAALVLAGCADDGEPAPAAPEPGAGLPSFGAPATAAPVTGTGPAGSAELLNRLLSGTDLPGSFTPLPPRATGGAAGTDATDPAGCVAVLTPIARQVPGARADAAVQYAGPDFSSIDIDAAAYPADGVAPALAAVQRTLRECVRYTDVPPPDAAGDPPITYEVAPFDQPAAGDSSTAYQVLVRSDDLTLHSAVALVQVGDALAQIAVTAPESVQPEVLTALTTQQVRRLRGIAGP
ncbi:hypothetical protein [Nocardia sp. NPDC057353]|uniref:hypothetical protein n=1 Tax=Nocardia sp. NPDC057353 TaxID=3346104 RepID=UPI00363B839A